MRKTFNQPHPGNEPKTNPVPACREQIIRHRLNDRLVIIRHEYVEICGGNRVAAALLNECEFVTKHRLSEGESPWFQRKAAYWVAALQGEASERTIREAFKAIKSLGLMEFKQANGDQAGAFYRFNIERVQAAIDALEPARDGGHPGKNDTPPQSELPTTPADSTGHPGKNVQGSHLLYTRAPEPLLEPFPNQQQQADSVVTDSPGQPSAPPTAARGGSFGKTLQAIKARGFPSTRLGEKWELGDRGAKTSGFTDEQLAGAIGGRDFNMSGVESPVGVILRAVDTLTEEPRRDGESFGPTLDAVRVAETQAQNGDDEGRERLERYAKCGEPEIEQAARNAILRVTYRQFQECGRVGAGGLAALKALLLCGDLKVEQTARLALRKIAESQVIPISERSLVQSQTAA